jgi:hypothetical protein
MVVGATMQVPSREPLALDNAKAAPNRAAFVRLVASDAGHDAIASEGKVAESSADWIRDCILGSLRRRLEPPRAG